MVCERFIYLEFIHGFASFENFKDYEQKNNKIKRMGILIIFKHRFQLLELQFNNEKQYINGHIDHYD